ncbi:MAG: glycosyltransferase [Caulobacteraceae bacterium]|nr:glycosyltransferase [Caulobacteraceae bacterium]
MSLDLKIYKSAGVPVTSDVHRRLDEANRARDAKDWAAAVVGYRDALRRDPTLAHIWIQLGHSHKEADQYPEAEVAYRQAAALNAVDAEPHLHLGHLRKRQGDEAAACRCYLRALRLAPGHPDALAELHSLATRATDIRPEDLLEILRPVMNDSDVGPEADILEYTADRAEAGVKDLLTTLKRAAPDLDAVTLDQLAAAGALIAEIGRKAAAEAAKAAPATNGPALVFDVSDLISYFRNARLPTGIQRVQIETISSALLARRDRVVKICCFLEHRDEWLEIPPAIFIALCRLSLSDGDRAAPEWTMALSRLYVLLNMAEAMVFPTGAYLINLGTSWWLQNYFLFVRQAKARSGIRYVPFVHDLIPVMAAEFCTRELTRDFISWAIGVFEHADFFLVNSQSTKRDLQRVAALLGHPVDDERIAVIRLDADFRKPVTAPVTKNALAGWGLRHKPFVLFVSTVEARKNHLCAFEAWLDLVRRHGPKAVPKLVCVGNRGWLNDEVYARLASNEALRDQVVMLSGLSDAELAQLYERCLFTVYPSRYEGWGLPITESLCHGKTPLVSDASSLPEAGGSFAVYFESGSAARLANALERLIFDRLYREACERKIAQNFKPRTWSAIADQIGDQAAAWAALPSAGPPRPPQAQLGAYHPIVRNFETRIWAGMRAGEVFRAGDGWWGPDDWGCWTKAQGGRLAIGLPDRHGPLRVYLRLHGLPGRASDYEIKAGDLRLGGNLHPGQFKWIPLDVPATETPAPVLEICLEGGQTEDLAGRTQGLDPRIVSVGLAGFYLCGADDADARAAFLEAVALDNLADLAFNRERVVSSASAVDVEADRMPAQRRLVRVVPA